MNNYHNDRHSHKINNKKPPNLSPHDKPTMLYKKYSNVLLSLLACHSSNADGDNVVQLVDSVAASFQLGKKHVPYLGQGKECLPLESKNVFNLNAPRKAKTHYLKGHFLRENEKDPITPDVGILSRTKPRRLKTVRGWRSNSYSDVKIPSKVEPDVGILSSSMTSSSCHGLNEICKVDPSSSMGGRCVSSIRNKPILEQHMQRKGAFNRGLQTEQNEVTATTATTSESSYGMVSTTMFTT